MHESLWLYGLGGLYLYRYIFLAQMVWVASQIAFKEGRCSVCPNSSFPGSLQPFEMIWVNPKRSAMSFTGNTLQKGLVEINLYESSQGPCPLRNDTHLEESPWVGTLFFLPADLAAQGKLDVSVQGRGQRLSTSWASCFRTMCDFTS